MSDIAQKPTALPPEELARLNEPIDQARREIAEGQGVPAARVIAELRAKRGD